MPLLAEYHRPQSLKDAVALLAQPRHIPLAGGTIINADRERSDLVGVDLQALGLDSIEVEATKASIGAMARLSEIEQVFDGDLLGLAARRELPSTLRTLGTIGGTVAAAESESLVLAALLASCATVETEDGSTQTLGDFLANPRGLIVSVQLETTSDWAFKHTGRTPMDTPIVAAMGRLSSDGITIALTGVASLPIAVRSLDEVNQIIPPADFRGSSEFRHHLAVKLSERVIGALS